MATLQLGRCVLPAVIVNSLSVTGDEVSVAGSFIGSSAAETMALIRQFVGYPNHDEPTVPLVVESSALTDGFVTDVATSAPMTHEEDIADGRVPFTLDCRRVPGWQAPLFEVLSRGADRPTAHSVTPWSWLGAPSSLDVTAAQFVDLADANGASGESVNSEAGKLAWFSAASATKDDLYDTEFLYQIAPAEFYAGACELEVTPDSGTTWRPVVGRQAPNEPAGWRLNNGIIRVSIDADGPTLTVDHWDETADDFVSKSYELKDRNLGYLLPGNVPGGSPPRTLTVLRNSPEMCSIRVWLGGSIDGPSTYLDLTLMRGCWFTQGVLVSPEKDIQFEVRRQTAEAGATVAGGLDAAGVDANGDKYQLRTPSAYTPDTTNGSIYLAVAAESMPFAIGLDLNEPTNPTTTGAYFAAMSHRQIVAAR